MSRLVDRVISGGQNGVDQAALAAARDLGIATGGWAPRAWATLDGPREQLLRDYGLLAHVGGYAARTRANVVTSDATLRLAANWESPGEICTERAIRRAGKPSLDVLWLYGRWKIANPRGFDYVERAVIRRVREWATAGGYRTLNVAGNSERTAPGIGSAARALLLEVLA